MPGPGSVEMPSGIGDGYSSIGRLMTVEEGKEGGDWSEAAQQEKVEEVSSSSREIGADAEVLERLPNSSVPTTAQTTAKGSRMNLEPGAPGTRLPPHPGAQQVAPSVGLGSMKQGRVTMKDPTNAGEDDGKVWPGGDSRPGPADHSASVLRDAIAKANRATSLHRRQLDEALNVNRVHLAILMALLALALTILEPLHAYTMVKLGDRSTEGHGLRRAMSEGTGMEPMGDDAGDSHGHPGDANLLLRHGSDGGWFSGHFDPGIGFYLILIVPGLALAALASGRRLGGWVVQNRAAVLNVAMLVWVAIVATETLEHGDPYYSDQESRGAWSLLQVRVLASLPLLLALPGSGLNNFFRAMTAGTMMITSAFQGVRVWITSEDAGVAVGTAVLALAMEVALLLAWDQSAWEDLLSPLWVYGTVLRLGSGQEVHEFHWGVAPQLDQAGKVASVAAGVILTLQLFHIGDDDLMISLLALAACLAVASYRGFVASVSNLHAEVLMDVVGSAEAAEALLLETQARAARRRSRRGRQDEEEVPGALASFWEEDGEDEGVDVHRLVDRERGFSHVPERAPGNSSSRSKPPAEREVSVLETTSGGIPGRGAVGPSPLGRTAERGPTPEPMPNLPSADGPSAELELLPPRQQEKPGTASIGRRHAGSTPFGGAVGISIGTRPGLPGKMGAPLEREFMVQDSATGGMSMSFVNTRSSGFSGKGQTLAFFKERPLAGLLFTDVVGYTNRVSTWRPVDVLTMLNAYFTEVDALVEALGVFKYETVGDAYVAATGIDVEDELLADRALVCAILMVDIARSLDLGDGHPLGQNGMQIRAGLHVGPCSAGLLGRKRRTVTLVGDTLNTASRMESNSKPDHVRVTGAFFVALKDPEIKEHFVRDDVDVKGKGWMESYLIDAKLPEAFAWASRFKDNVPLPPGKVAVRDSRYDLFTKSSNAVSRRHGSHFGAAGGLRSTRLSHNGFSAVAPGADISRNEEGRSRRGLRHSQAGYEKSVDKSVDKSAGDEGKAGGGRRKKSASQTFPSLMEGDETAEPEVSAHSMLR